MAIFLFISSLKRFKRSKLYFIFFFFNDTATTEIYTLSLHDALPIYCSGLVQAAFASAGVPLPRDSYQQEAFTDTISKNDQIGRAHV